MKISKLRKITLIIITIAITKTKTSSPRLVKMMSTIYFMAKAALLRY
jgi:hypothetical protein